MNQLILKPIISNQDKNIFTKEIQEAFQNSYEKEFGKFEKQILPKNDIKNSFNEKDSKSYFAEINGKRIGGIIVSINNITHRNSLQLFYVKLGMQNKGNGLKIWQAIENLYPETKVWETYTPYFDKRNIHFYINRCGFKIVEFFNPKHQEPQNLENIPEENNYFFKFEKTTSKFINQNILNLYL